MINVVRTIEDNSKLFFTSDTHFYHANIIDFCNRPYSSIEEMNRVLISNWNAVVPKDGIVYHLGDFAFTGNIGSIKNLVDQLNGEVHLILGNHDLQNKFTRENVIKLFASVSTYAELRVKDEDVGDYVRIVLSHYPFLTWNKKAAGAWNLFGHIHSGIYSKSSEGGLSMSMLQYDVGVDNNGYTPISYGKLMTMFTHRTLNIEE